MAVKNKMLLNLIIDNEGTAKKKKNQSFGHGEGWGEIMACLVTTVWVALGCLIWGCP